MEQVHLQQALATPPLTTATTTDVHSTPVANATSNSPHLTSDHPSYAEMITAAILWDNTQGKAGGSSKRAIAKYIDRVYTNLPPTHSALLTHHLKRLKNTGQLVMIKNSYQLPIVAATTIAASIADTTVDPIGSDHGPIPSPTQIPHIYSTPKKRPGRPPKAQSIPQPGSGATNGLLSGRRPRGRPPREQQLAVSEVPFVQAQVQMNVDSGLNNNGSPQTSVKRSRGRPKKNADTQTQDPAQFQVVVPMNGIVSPKKRPGRPPKAKVANGVVGQVSSSGGGPKPRGRPKRNVLGPASKPVGKKPRGRPPRQLGVGATFGKRRAGRPPKGSVLPLPKAVMRKLYTGKPRGRPKKSASALGKPEKRMVDEELIKKVKNMQAKVRDAVGMLKPYFPYENATNEALVILQQLEDISMMDISAPPPPNPPVEPPLPVEPPPNPPATTIPMNDPVIQSGPSEFAPVMTEPAPFYMPNSGSVML